MLDFALEVRGDSRLACQVTVSPQLNGLVVAMPVAQS
jgi:2Fe-2S ferredoxin